MKNIYDNDELKSLCESYVCLPNAPSANALFHPAKVNGKMVMLKTDAYKKWQSDCMWLIKGQKAKPYIGREYAVLLLIERPNNASDVDNRVKGFIDCLTASKIIEDDRYMASVTPEWIEPTTNNFTHAFIFKDKRAKVRACYEALLP